MNHNKNNSMVYSWDNCPEQIKYFINNILEHYKKVLGDNLIGFYLHGSLAMNCFNPLSSDIDFLAVVKEKLTVEQKGTIIEYFLKQYENMPAKGIEMSIILENYLKDFAYPTPFELHYSNMWYEQYKSGKVDYSKQNYDVDLAAHFVIIRNRGICLFGRPIEELFSEIPKSIYAQSLLSDADCIYKDVEKEPIYTILNLCRILAFLKDNKITSKKEGGEWALLKLPKKFSSLINSALQYYLSPNKDEQININALKNFVEYTKREINSLKGNV